MKPTVDEILEAALNPPRDCAICPFLRNNRIFMVCEITQYVIGLRWCTKDGCKSSDFYDYLFNKMI